MRQVSLSNESTRPASRLTATRAMAVVGRDRRVPIPVAAFAA